MASPTPEELAAAEIDRYVESLQTRVAELEAFMGAALPVISQHIDWIEGRGPRFASTHGTSSRDARYALDLARHALKGNHADR